MSEVRELLRARHFALAAHDEQLYGDLPYEYHLQKCQDVHDDLVTQGMIEEWDEPSWMLRAALWLHDVLEDTDVRPAILHAAFPITIFELVHAVSDAHGQNRKEKKWGTRLEPGPYVKIPEVPGAIIVKLVDRIANVQASISARDKLGGKYARHGLLDMYNREQLEFRGALYEPNKATEPLWAHLEELLRK